MYYRYLLYFSLHFVSTFLCTLESLPGLNSMFQKGNFPVEVPDTLMEHID